MKFRQLEARAFKIVGQVISELPEDIASTLGHVPVLLEGTPSDDSGIEADCLGVFEGSSLLEANNVDYSETPRITLFLTNLWDEAEGDPGVFDAEVKITLLHEIGHYLGWDEEEVERHGL